jgi:cell division septum initiation protein DivIVA
MRGAANALHEETRARVEQMTSDLEVKLAARREEAERLDAERHDQAVAQATQLVAEAEQRAAAAEQRAAKAVEQAESVRRDADEHAKGLLGTARRNAEQVLAEARQHADKVMSDAKAEAERTRRAAQRQVDDLIRQRDSITGHLDQLRHLLGAFAGSGAAQAAASPQQQAGETAQEQGNAPDDRTITLPAEDRTLTLPAQQPETANR